MPRIHVRPSACVDDVEMEPHFVQVFSDPMHIWLGDEHYVESDDRRAEVGKYYLDSNTGMFQRVVDVADADRPVPDYIDVDDGGDEVTVETIYDTTSDEPALAEPVRDTVPRYVLETEDAINMGDVVQTPFVRQD